jgi:hypothetical protein
MPRGVKLTQAEKDTRQAIKDAKIAERRWNKTQGIKRTYTKKTPAQIAEKLFAFTQRTPRTPRRKLTEYEKTLREQMKVQKQYQRQYRNRKVSPTAEDKALKELVYGKRTYTRKPRSNASKNMSALKTQMNADYLYSQMKTPGYLAPLSSYEKTKAKNIYYGESADSEQKRLIRNEKARERYARKRLMDLGQSVPLPPSPAPVRPRVRRVIRQYPALPASYR